MLSGALRAATFSGSTRWRSWAASPGRRSGRWRTVAGRPPMLIPRSTLQFRFITGALLVVGVATTAPRAVAAPLFTAPFLSFDTGDSPTSVVIGDVNADGNLDLV